MKRMSMIGFMEKFSNAWMTFGEDMRPIIFKKKTDLPKIRIPAVKNLRSVEQPVEYLKVTGDPKCLPDLPDAYVENLKYLTKFAERQARMPLFFAHWLKPAAPLTIRDKIRIAWFKFKNLFRRDDE